MQIQHSLIIDAPVSFCAAHLRNSDLFHRWQDDFKSATLLSGERDQVGATSRLLYAFGKGEMELIETIDHNDLPHSFSATYEHKHMDNTMKSSFRDIGDDRTEYRVEVDYIRFKGWMIKIMSRLFASKFKAGPVKWMNQFKALVESEYQTSKAL